MSTKLKITKTGSDARNELMKGAKALADAVSSTLGPFGQNFLLEKGDKVTNDGVTIAREMEMKDVIQNRGMKALREASIRTNDEAGDGTTSAIVLAYAILKEAVKYLGDDKKVAKGKKTHSEVRNQIERERKEVVDKLSAMATPITSKEQLIASAKVSVEDDELAALIGGTQWDLGKEAILIAEETNDRTSSVELVNGIRIDNGFSSSLVINDPEKQALDVKETRVILTNHVIQALNPLLPLLQQLAKSGVTNVVLMARAFTEQSIKDCMENIKTGFNIYPVNAPYTDQNEVMKDLAAVLGGRYIALEDTNLEDTQVSDVGYAERMIIKRYSATISGKKDDKSAERIEKRVKELKDRLISEPSTFERRNINQRIAQLTNGFGIIKVGAMSEIERKRLKDKCDDCVNAVRLAYQGGVVPGAGLALKQISDGLPDTYILKTPLRSIYEQIMFTAPEGFVIEDWVKDPRIVIETALDKACSVATALATAAGATATQRDPVRYVQESNNSNEDEE